MKEDEEDALPECQDTNRVQESILAGRWDSAGSRHRASSALEEEAS